MLQVSYIREHQAEVIDRLSKRTNEANSLIEAVLKLDESPFLGLEPSSSFC